MKPRKIIKEERTARLTILVDPNKKKVFENLCNHLDVTPSQVLRQMIRDFLNKHNVIWKTKNE
ncbi:MAG: CopG family transcriptional regulator [Alphaproteobacteria bacterium]|nr:CopG family transcriptional regulator [Alphaproteobacteria bacterium]